MKKTILFSILIILYLIHRFHLHDFKANHRTQAKVITQPVSPALVSGKQTTSNFQLRGPAQESRKKRASLKNSFKPNNDISLGKSYVLTEDVAAISNKDYSSYLGPLVEQDKRWSYFKNLSGLPQIPVVYSSSKNNFFPVSKIIQIHQVTPELKDQLLREGFREYHYSKSLKLLFVESHPDQILQTYVELKERGLRADLEILAESYKKH